MDTKCYTICCNVEVDNGHGEIITCPDCGEKTGLDIEEKE